MWRKPRCEGERLSLALRRTLAQRILVKITRDAAASSHLRSAVPLMGSRVRARRLLWEIEQLKQRQAAGIPLRLAQVRKLEREGALREWLASKRASPPGAILCTWMCANPLCGRLNPFDADRCLLCNISGPAEFSVVGLLLWRKCMSRRWLWASRVVQRHWRRSLAWRRRLREAVLVVQIAYLRRRLWMRQARANTSNASVEIHGTMAGIRGAHLQRSLPMWCDRLR